MPRNKLSDLNNHLFAQLERLNDEDLSDEQIEREIKRAKAVSSIGMEIVKSSRLTLDAARLVAEGYITAEKVPDGFGVRRLSGHENGIHNES